MSELRYNPTLGEWVVTATHRQERTFFPPKDYCPLCPTRPGSFPTEVPREDYEIVVFENKFPTFRREPEPPAISGDELYRVKPSLGICEVVLYSPRHEGSLTDLPLAQIENLVEVWADRYQELGSLSCIDYVFIFENKGEEIGVTLSHPHGQIYAFSYIPPIPQKELRQAQEHYHQKKSCLYCDILEEEGKDGRRIVTESACFCAFVPFFARYPYEVHIYSQDHLGSLAEMDKEKRRDLAHILKTLLTTYDNLFGFSFPYMMVFHQSPTDGKSYPYYHFHIEFYPPYRSRDKLKYLAGCESGAGTFINDTLPEEKAEELRRASAG